MSALVALGRLQRDLGSLKRAGGENCSDCGTVPCREGIWSARNNPGARRMELEVQESLSARGQGNGAGICSWRTTGGQINSSEGNFGPDSIIPIPNKS